LGLDSENEKVRVQSGANMEKCNVPNCLRGVENKGDVCKKCLMNLPPMDNPKSPHAYNNPSGTGTASPKADIKPEKPSKIPFMDTTIDVDKVKERWDKIPINPIHTRKSKPKADKIVAAIMNPDYFSKKAADRKTQKEAVKTIFKSYWFGWPNGTPAVFKELFEQYGEFISERITPSKMVGNPKTHKSTINAGGNEHMNVVVQVIYPPGRQRDEREAYEFIENSQLIQEALNESGTRVPTTHAIELLKNDGQAFTFTRAKEDGSLYTYEDAKGKVWKIPRWAIA